jgi:transposase
MGTLLMSTKERLRLAVLTQVATGSMSLSEAAVKLGISYRQIRRLRQRHADEGDAGLVHQLRGRSSNRQVDPKRREEALSLCRQRYAGFGPTLAAEYLSKEDGLRISHDTLRRWMLTEGLMPGHRRGRKHRTRRARRSRRGELVQMDGSWHDWFEGRGAWCCLMVMIDDATGHVHARFYEKETLSAAFDVFGRYARTHGLPMALYVDRSGIYRNDQEPTVEQALAGKRPVTQFGRAMRHLDVELILANSPQAKGRVERMNGTLQDRLVKAMRLAGIGDIASANRLLDESFLASFNERFMVPAADEGDAHRMTDESLSEVLCEQHERKVGRDWCVQWRGTLLQIARQHESLGLAGKTVTLRESPGEDLAIVWQGRRLSWHLAAERPKRPRNKPVIENNKAWKPASGHPWRTGRLSASPPSPTAPSGLPTNETPRTFLLR